MKLPSIVSALPPESSTGWGVASRRITEELSKIAMVSDLRNNPLIGRDFPVEFDVPLLQAIRGVDMLPIYPHLYAKKRVGYCFIEDNILLKQYARNAYAEYEHIVCGSTWATQQMNIAVPYIPVSTAIQGVDAHLFCPLEWSAWSDGDKERFTDRFTIWSAGKFEYRKSQDVVIRAVQVMMGRHRDVHLMASWWNPWEFTQATMANSKLVQYNGGPVEALCNAHLDMRRVTLLSGPMSHQHLVNSMRMCHVGLFPNRCEAGTNLPLMEAQSCAMPVIATVQHGHADVTRFLSSDKATGCFRLSASPVKFERLIGGEPVAVGDWFEPDLEEVIEALENAYIMRNHIPAVGLANQRAMANFTWADCAQSILEALTND